MEYTAQTFRDIELLLPVLENYIRSGSKRMDFQTMEKKIHFQNLCKTVLNMPNPPMTCDTCVITNMERLISIYEKEFPKFIEKNYQASKNQPEPEPAEKTQKKPSKKKAQ